MKYAKLMFAAAVMVLPVLAAAQLPSGQSIVAQVPFEFVAGNKLVPAGGCSIRTATMDGKTLVIRNAGAGMSLFSPASGVETKEAAGSYAMIFHKQGNQYFLRGISLRGSRAGYQLPESKAEAELRAQNGPATEEVVLASLR